MANERTVENAFVMAGSVTAAIKNRVHHYDSAGRLLATPAMVLECLKREGRVTVDESMRIEVTTTEKEIAALKARSAQKTARIGMDDMRMHDWELGTDGWGVVLGVSRCKVCGIRSSKENVNGDCVSLGPPEIISDHRIQRRIIHKKRIPQS